MYPDFPPSTPQYELFGRTITTTNVNVNGVGQMATVLRDRALR